MGVDLATPILTRRGLLRYNEVTTDDETMARLPDASLVWTPITGISVVENQHVITVTAPRATFRCSYDQRVWISRRIRTGYYTREFLGTLDTRLSQDAVILSGVYLGGLTGRRSHMSVAEARLLGLLVAGKGEFYETDGLTHLMFQRNDDSPRWFLRMALVGIDHREYNGQMIVSPEKSRRMWHLMRKPFVDILFTMTLDRREEFLSIFFGQGYPHDVPEDVSLACYLCAQTFEYHRGTAVQTAGSIPLFSATYTDTIESTWSVTTEADGWTVMQDGRFMALST